MSLMNLHKAFYDINISNVKYLQKWYLKINFSNNDMLMNLFVYNLLDVSLCS